MRCLAEYDQLFQWHRKILNTIHFRCDVCVNEDGCLPHDVVVCWEDMLDNVTRSCESDSDSGSKYFSSDGEKEEDLL